MQRSFFAVVAFLSLWMPAEAADLNVMFGVSRPPYIMEETQTGIVFEVAAVIFERMGLSFEPLFGSNKRMERELMAGHIDVAVEVRPADNGIFYSKPFVVYQNFAVSRTLDEIEMTAFSDLEGRSVCAWQGAAEHVGDRLQQAIPKFASYREFAVQEEQVRAWLAGLCEVILIDKTLLNWHMRHLLKLFRSQGRKVDTEIEYHPLPGENEVWFHAGFRDESLRDRFDEILSEIRRDGTYDSIRNQFLKRN